MSKPREDRRILQVWLTNDEFAAVEALAEKNRRSNSAMGRELIIEAIDRGHPEVQFSLSEDQIRDAVKVMQRMAAQGKLEEAAPRIRAVKAK